MKIGPLTVIPFDEYKQKLNPDLELKGPYNEVFYNNYETKFELVERDKIKDLFAKIDADYIYVIWAPGISSRVETNRAGNVTTRTVYYDLTLFGMLFSREMLEKEIGITDLSGSKAEGCCLFNLISGRSAKDDKADLVREIVDRIQHEMEAQLAN